MPLEAQPVGRRGRRSVLRRGDTRPTMGADGQRRARRPTTLAPSSRPKVRRVTGAPAKRPPTARVKVARPRQPRRTSVFVSFDFDHDRVLRDFVIGQARNLDSPFWVRNYSLKEAGPTKTWQLEAERRIARCTVMLVMVGPHTHRAREIGRASCRERVEIAGV